MIIMRRIIITIIIEVRVITLLSFLGTTILLHMTIAVTKFALSFLVGAVLIMLIVAIVVMRMVMNILAMMCMALLGILD